MSFDRHIEMLAGDTPGATTQFTWFSLGPADASSHVYLQAALHADEMPGTMLLHHLLPRLRDADATGQLRGRFTVVPMANPMGLQNLSFRHHIGRSDLNTGINYNRRWPNLFAAMGAGLVLDAEPTANLTTVRRGLAAWIDSQQPRSANERLRLHILRLMHDADFVLDLHCDSDSLTYIYTAPDVPAEDLADWTGAVATMTASDSGGGSFDEMLPGLYRRLNAANPTAALPVPLGATLEYRGQSDVSDALGADDARGLFGFFCTRGLVDADPGELPWSAPKPTPLEATEVIRAPAPGLVAYRVALGERVTRGQPVADIIAMDGPDAFFARTTVTAGTDGLVLTRSARKYAEASANIMKIVGTEPLPGRSGYLLED